MLLETPPWSCQTYYPTLLRISVEESFILLQDYQLLMIPQQEPHTLVTKESLTFWIFWTIGQRFG